MKSTIVWSGSVPNWERRLFRLWKLWSGSIVASTQIWLAAGMLSVHKYLLPQKSGILPAPRISCWVILSSPALRCWTRARYPLSQLLAVSSDCGNYGVEASLLPHKNLTAGMLSVHKYLLPQKSGILPAPSMKCWVILSSPALRCWTRARYPLSQLLAVSSDCGNYGVEASLTGISFLAPPETSSLKLYCSIRVKNKKSPLQRGIIVQDR